MKKIFFILLLLCSSYVFANKSALASVKPYSITFSVKDIEKMKSWYVNKLGFKVLNEKDYPEFSTSLVFLGLNGYRVELIKDGNANKKAALRARPPAHTALWGVSQFCFLTQDLATLKKELAQKNIPLEWEFSNKELGVKFLFIRDLEGNLIQYLQKL